MTQQKRRQTDKDRDVPTNVPPVSDFDMDAADDGMWSEEELERASMGWRAEDKQEAPNVPINAPYVDDLDTDLEDTIADSADALTDMTAREMRRDQNHRSGGDDYNPGFDSDIDANGPKEDDLSTKKRAGSRG